MAVKILEDYMKTNAAAVLMVAESVEKLRAEEGGISSPEEAAAISVAMYGAPPKPAAGSVASIVVSPRKRLAVEDKSMADHVVMSMSVARYGIENNRSRAEAAAENIGKTMEEITAAAPATCTNTLDRVFVGLNDDNTPRVDRTKYKLVGDKKITLASFQDTAVIESVENNLKDILSEVQDRDQQQGANKYVKVLASNISMNSIISWADGVEAALKDHERLAAPDNYFPLISRHASKVKLAVKEIMSLVGKSYCRTATQLTSARDISKFQKATDICYTALMAETHERIVSDLLFYVSFKTVDSATKDYVKNRLGAMAGTAGKKGGPPVISVERRDAAETLFGLCFMFKIMPPEFVDSVLTFPSADLSYHGVSGTRLAPLLSYYGPCFEASWVRFNSVLAERSRVVRAMLNERIDYVDATANFTGPVYVLVGDVANAFQAQRTCAYKLLNEIKEQYRLWDTFVQAH